MQWIVVSGTLDKYSGSGMSGVVRVICVIKFVTWYIEEGFISEVGFAN